MNVKKNDTVVVLSGKDKGKKGKVLEAMPATGKVVIRHQRRDLPRQAEEAGRRRRHHPSRNPHVRFQGDARLPEMRQGDPRSFQG